MSRSPSRGAALARGAGAVVVGYLVYALATMGAVWLWYMRPGAPTGLISIVGAVISVEVVALLTALVASAVAGPTRRTASRVLAVVVALVCVVNLMLGVAIEPPWFTVLALISVPLAVLTAGRRPAS